MDTARRRLIERRHAIRYGAPDHAIVYARVRPGHVIDVLDASATGIFIEAAHRLLPGTLVDLYLERGTERTALRGRVVRCLVTTVLAHRMRYRGAVCFERPLLWLNREGLENIVPISTGQSFPTSRGLPTRTGDAARWVCSGDRENV